MTQSRHTAMRAALTSPWLSRIALTLLGAVLSMLASGFIPGHNNNFFHLPILGKLYDLPQFAEDPFVQSLRSYSTGLWLTLAGAAPDHAFPLLFLLDLASRLIFFGGALACASLVAIVTLRSRLAFVVLLAFSSMLRDYAYAGGGDLFTIDFSHSDIANGMTLWTIYFAIRGRFVFSFAANGITFFLNAFMAAWNAVPIALIAVAHLISRTLTPWAITRRMLIGLPAFLIIACPVLLVALHNPEAGAQRTFDYRTFLFEYFPAHFFISAIPRHEIIQLAIIAAAGVIALLHFGREGRGLLLALIGFSLVWLFGTIAPDIIPSNGVILLHLLRVSAEVQIFAAIGVAAIAARWLDRPRSWQARLWGPLLAFTTTIHPDMLAWALLPLLAGRFDHRVKPPILLPILIFGLLLLHSWPGQIKRKMHASAQGYHLMARWRDSAAWARDHTAPSAIFLIPVSPIHDGPHALGRIDPVREQLGVGSEVFEYVARRRIWTDYKMGGAVMWRPSYYPRWKQDVVEVMSLSSLAARLDYARRHGIAFVIDGCVAATIAAPVYRTEDLCIYRA